MCKYKKTEMKTNKNPQKQYTVTVDRLLTRVSRHVVRCNPGLNSISVSIPCITPSAPWSADAVFVQKCFTSSRVWTLVQRLSEVNLIPHSSSLVSPSLAEALGDHWPLLFLNRPVRTPPPPGPPAPCFSPCNGPHALMDVKSLSKK